MKLRDFSPSAVTLGETSSGGLEGQGAGDQARHAKVDWLTATWKPEPDEHVPATVLGLLRGLGLPAEADQSSGHFGFQHGARLFIRLDDGSRHQIALLDWGGDRMKGRARLDLSGSACSLVRDWQLMQDWLASQWETTITRVDLAVDCLQGEFTVDHAVGWLKEGRFVHRQGGRPPRHSTPGDWLSDQPTYGRTLEIGRRENGKMLRAYEKGLQLRPGSGDRWTRFEVEIRRRDRDIPLDVLTRPDHYFAGAYECLQDLIHAAPERIATHQKEGELTADELVQHCATGYGKLIGTLRLHLTADELLDAISRPGIPARLEKASLGGYQPASRAAQLE